MGLLREGKKIRISKIGENDIQGSGCQIVGKLVINAHYFGQTNLKAVILVLYKWIYFLTASLRS